MHATDLTKDQLRHALELEASGDPRPMFEIRWQLGANPYQQEPCKRCRWQERWRQEARWDGRYWQGNYGCMCEAGIDLDYGVWLFLSGRGVGKTLTGSHWAIRQALRYPGSYGGVIAPTLGDLRAVLVEGPTGLIRALPRDLVLLNRDGNVWRQGANEIHLKNGSVIRTLSAEKPDRIRGANLNWVWADELASWTRLEYAWEQLEMATRVGAPRFLITTTPRPLPLIKYLRALEDTISTSASTFDNPHLSARYRARMQRFVGTRVGRQELEGEILEDVEGALWSWTLVEEARLKLTEIVPESMERIVVAVDPSGGGQSEVGIIVAGIHQSKVYILADYSMHGTPNAWASRVIAAYDEFQADRVVGERNYGGDMVEATIRSAASGRHVSYSDVTASRGKQLRAEPVVSLYESGLVRHCVDLPDLEHQLTSWVPNTGMPSPDRLDALVWAATELALGEPLGGTSLADLLVAPSGLTRQSPWRH